MGLGSSIYKMVIDTGAARADVVATRREIALQKQIIEATTPVIEKYGAGLDVMQNQLQKGLITLEQHAELHRQLKAELPENVAAEAALNAVFREGESVRRSLMTADQQAAEQSRLYEDAVRGFLQLQREGILVGDKALEAAEKLRANTPAAIQAERDRAEALKHSNDVIRDGEAALREFLTVDEKFAAAEKRHAAAKRGVVQLQDAGVITDDDAGERLSRLRGVSPAVIRDERLFADALREGANARRGLMTATDHLAESEKRWADAKRAVVRLQDAGNISDDEAGRRLAALRANSPGLIQAERERAAAVDRGRMLTQQYMPVLQQHQMKLNELHTSYKAGHVSLSTYLSGTTQLTAAQLSSLPIIGRVAASVAVFGPAGAAAAAGLAAVTVGITAIGAAAVITVRHIADQIAKTDQLVSKSQSLGVPVGQFIKLQHAADLADLSNQQLSQGMETLLSNVSKAADGSPKLAKAFAIIGEDAATLRDMQPEQILSRVTTALDKTGNSVDRMRAATTILGSPDWLRFNPQNIVAASELLDDLRFKFTEFDGEQFNKMDDSVKRMNFSLDTTWKKVSMEATPAIRIFADGMTDVLKEMNQSDRFANGLERAGNLMRGMAVAATTIARDIPDAIDAITHFVVPDSLMELLDKIETVGKLQRFLEGHGTVASRREPRAGDRERDTSTHVGQAKALDDMTESLNSQIATMGMGSEKAKLYEIRLEAVKSVLIRDRIALNESLIAERDRLQEQEKVIASGEQMRDQLIDRHRQLSMSTLDYELNKIAMSKLGDEEKVYLQHLVTENAELEKKIQKDKEAEEQTKRRADATKSLIERLTEQAETAGMTERQKAEREIDKTIDDLSQRAAAKNLLDRADATTKLADASRLAAETIKDLEKQRRQAGMTPDEKKLDDLAVAGVNVEQLAIIDTLQKEVALRDKIHEQITATSSVLKIGSREAADAIALAQRIAVINQFKRSSEPINSGGPIISAPIISGAPVISAMSGPVGVPSTPVTATPRSVPPMILPAVDKEQVTEIKKTNDILTKIERKTVPATIEEVDLI